MLWGWGVGRYPGLLVGSLGVEEAAGSPAMLRALLVAPGVGAVLLIPSTAWLLVLAQRGVLGEGGGGPAATPSGETPCAAARALG